MKHLLEISKSEFNFSLLQGDDNFIEAQIIIPFAHQELSKADFVLVFAINSSTISTLSKTTP
jgi:hypothetical protein